MAVLRSILFYLGLLSISFFAFTILVIIIILTRRRYHFSFIRYCCLAVIHWMRITCGVRFQVQGRENLPHSEAMVIAANHQSDWETFYLLTMGVPVSTVLKKELLHIPFFGWTLALANPIVIDRKHKAEALKKILQQGNERLQNSISVLIFPEGTRTAPGRLGICTKGAARLSHRSAVPILPIVQNSGRLSPPKSWIKHAGLITVRIGTPVRAATSEELHTQMVKWLRQNLADIDG